jgi:hypothetical protein
LRDPAPVDEDRTAIGERHRSHDIVTSAPYVDLVVDEDLPRRDELAGRDDGTITQCGPIGVVRKDSQSDRLGARSGIELREQRFLRLQTLVLPVSGRDANGDRGNGAERREHTRPRQTSRVLRCRGGLGSAVSGSTPLTRPETAC